MKKFLRFILSFRGRISRRQYLMYSFAVLPVLFVVLFCAGILVHIVTTALSLSFMEAAIRDFSILGLMIAVLWILISLICRRLHDLNLPGWSMILFILVCILLCTGLFFLHCSRETVRMVGDFLSSIAFLTFWFAPGTKGSNRYGENPRAKKLPDTA